MFSYNGLSGPESKTTRRPMFRPVLRVAELVGGRVVRTEDEVCSPRLLCC